MAKEVKNEQDQETPTVTPVPFSPNTPGPPIKMIAIIAGIVLVVGIIALGVYLFLSNPSRPLNDAAGLDETFATTDENDKEDADEEEDEEDESEEMAADDDESILERIAFNVLEADSLAYTYRYDSTNDFALGVSDDDPDGQSNGSLSINAEYRFRAVNLDDPDEAIVRQDISMTYNPRNGGDSTIIEFNVIRHQDDFYIQLFNLRTGLFLPLVDQSAADALQDKWLKFTLDGGQFRELEDGSLDHLDDSSTGFLLGIILREMITVNANNRGEIIIPLDFFASISYLSSPFAFGVADNRSAQRSIFGTMVGFGENSRPGEPETVFVISGCEKDVGETMTCQAKSQINDFEAGDMLGIYSGLLDKTNLSNILPLLTEDDWDQLLLNTEDVTSHQGEVTVDLSSNLPLLASFTTVFEAERETAETGSHNWISGEALTEMSFEGFDEDLELSLPTSLTPLSELR